MISIKKHIDLSYNDVQEILNGLPTKMLTDELFSRDARMVVDNLEGSQQLDLFRELTHERNRTTAIIEELDYISKKRASTLSLRDLIKKEGIVKTVDAILNCFSMQELVATISTFISE